MPAARGLRIKEAADYIGATPWYLEILIRSNQVPAYELGRHHVLFREGLDTFIDKLKANAA
jgi:excisionase family DNA binding protein